MRIVATCLLLGLTLAWAQAPGGPAAAAPCALQAAGAMSPTGTREARVMRLQAQLSRLRQLTSQMHGNMAQIAYTLPPVSHQFALIAQAFDQLDRLISELLCQPPPAASGGSLPMPPAGRTSPAAPHSQSKPALPPSARPWQSLTPQATGGR